MELRRACGVNNSARPPFFLFTSPALSPLLPYAHSDLSATFGSTRAALVAGMYDAIRVTNTTIAVAVV